MCVLHNGGPRVVIQQPFGVLVVSFMLVVSWFPLNMSGVRI